MPVAVQSTDRGGPGVLVLFTLTVLSTAGAIATGWWLYRLRSAATLGIE